LTAGQVFELGSRKIDREEILRFATEFDPQPFHIDEEAAAASPYGGLIASGWQTIGIFMRLLVDGVLGRAAGMGAPGVDELRWLKPVRPGDELRGRFTIIEVIPSRSKPDRGIARCQCELFNQEGDAVLRMIALILMGRRS
jgi:acyl dehydratase